MSQRRNQRNHHTSKTNLISDEFRLIEFLRNVDLRISRRQVNCILYARHTIIIVFICTDGASFLKCIKLTIFAPKNKATKARNNLSRTKPSLEVYSSIFIDMKESQIMYFSCKIRSKLERMKKERIPGSKEMVLEFLWFAVMTLIAFSHLALQNPYLAFSNFSII